MSAAKDKPTLSYYTNNLTKDDIAKFKKILSILQTDKNAVDFLEPVDYVAFNIPDYPWIIKHPMDLGTVGNKWTKGEYSTIGEVLEDVNWIWDNCRLYNIKDSVICKLANHCEKAFKRQFEKLFKQYITSSNIPEIKNNKEIKEPTSGNNGMMNMNEKMNLTDKIRMLNNESLTKVVNLIGKECEKGIEDIDSEKLQIKIDWIDHRTYLLCIDLIEKCMKNGNNSNGEGVSSIGQGSNSNNSNNCESGSDEKEKL